MRSASWFGLSVLILLAPTIGCAGVLDQLATIDPNLIGDRSTAEDGLKEALSVGTKRAIDKLAESGGYSGDTELRIPLPEKLDKIGRALRKIGLDRVVDEFEASMNQAAEEAAPLASEVFLDSIRAMTFDDAMAILGGDAHEATDYFREKTSPRLRELFHPKVEEKLLDVGATRKFNDLMKRVEQLPFLERPPLDLADYVTEAALDGLFVALGREEQLIREDPIARTTELLKRWFGGRTG